MPPSVDGLGASVCVFEESIQHSAGSFQRGKGLKKRFRPCAGQDTAITFLSFFGADLRGRADENRQPRIGSMGRNEENSLNPPKSSKPESGQASERDGRTEKVREKERERRTNRRSSAPATCSHELLLAVRGDSAGASRRTSSFNVMRSGTNEWKLHFLEGPV